MALTQTRAEARSHCIIKGTINYDFHLSLESGHHYNGLAEITFELSAIPTELALDFKSKDIKKTIINEHAVHLMHEDGFLFLEL